MSSSEQSARELTVKSIGLGLFLAFVFGAANAYLGMKAGQTVAATIPAAVIAMALFRLPAFRGGVLEQNIARTAASVGEALVAGAIFTLPAFVLVEVDGKRLWEDLGSHYWQGALILMVGGIAGILFIILLRRALCGDAALPFPESVATFEIVKSGEEAGEAPRLVFGGMAFGGLIQILKSDKGLQVFREFAEGFLAFPRSVVRHFDFSKAPIGSVEHAGGIPWATPSLSPALIGIGYIIGPKYSSISVAGGVLAWWALIPLLLFFDPDLPRRIGGASTEVAAYTLWYNIVRPIAVGMMLVGAANTLFSMRGALWSSLRGAFKARGHSGHSDSGVPRTERDIPVRLVFAALAVLIIPVAAIYYGFTAGVGTALGTTLFMGAAGFFLCAVGGYLVGLVGSSNQPLSGLTLAALVLAALLMQAMGLRGAAGIAAVLGVAAVVAVAISVSGSLVQDLKAGQLLGGTPWKMQLVEMLAVVLLSFFLLGPIIALHQANLATGGIGGRALPAPQAGLMAQLAKGMTSGDMAWGLLAIGAAFGAALLLSGAQAMMLIAVGMYLPFDTTSAIFLGGLIKWIADQLIARRSEESRRRSEEASTLLASGLIAGEAIVGILLAVLFLTGVSSLTHVVTGSDQFSWFPAWGGWLSLAAFGAIAWTLIAIPRSKGSGAS
jgi:putative OPT family oligopeptide transporter